MKILSLKNTEILSKLAKDVVFPAEEKEEDVHEPFCKLFCKKRSI
jgi:hypothetical protein